MVDAPVAYVELKFSDVLPVWSADRPTGSLPWTQENIRKWWSNDLEGNLGMLGQAEIIDDGIRATAARVAT